jgi:protein phosphatase
MGGLDAGEIASTIAIDTISHYLEKKIEKIELEDCEINKLLLKSLDLANLKIIQENNRNPSLRGMGTTVVVVMVFNGNLHIANIGDSRAYLIDNNFEKIVRVTKDHTLVEDIYNKGMITANEKKNHQLRHILTQALGLQKTIRPFINVIKFSINEYLLLCSDGLTGMVSDDEILKILKNVDHDSIEAKCHKLVEIANMNGGLDNISIILLKNEGSYK